MPEWWETRVLRWKFNLFPARIGNVDLVDAEGVVRASIEKAIYIRRKT
ncbi:MAG: hypothetical protein JWO56_2594 [Acidobacteria bacterium]|nr:hypothetical protein [Acidobacteriota bacterium]